MLVALALARTLRLALRREPGKPCAPRVRESMRFTLSKEGQEIIAKDGYVPLRAAQAAEDRRKVD